MESITKVDLHRHLGGCIPPEFVWAAIKKQKLHYLAETYYDVIASMTFAADEPTGFHRFLKKFALLDEIRWDEELIEESIKQVCHYILVENLSKVWLRFSISKYVNHLKWHRRDIIKHIYNLFKKYAGDKVDLVLSIKYESERAGQRQLASLIDDPDVTDSVIGLDLVGDEEFYDIGFYAPIFKSWKEAGKLIFAHVGESQDGSNVASAIKAGVTEICHGIKSSPETLKLAKDRDACFHLALTSNYLTGVVSKHQTHPLIHMAQAGVQITLGTDDPIQCHTSLDKEYKLAESLLLEYSPEKAQEIVDHIKQTAAKRSLRSQAK